MCSSGNQDRVPASPLATGDAGGEFETHLGAACLALLLAEAPPPVLHGCRLQEICFQAPSFTDDLQLVALTPDGTQRTLHVQAKRQLTIGASDGECRKTFEAFWRDFRSDKFDSQRDALALAVQLGTRTLVHDFRLLLDQARASLDEHDFAWRLTTNHVTAKSRAQVDVIRDIVEQVHHARAAAYLRLALGSAGRLLPADRPAPRAHYDSGYGAVRAHGSQCRWAGDQEPRAGAPNQQCRRDPGVARDPEGESRRR